MPAQLEYWSHPHALRLEKPQLQSHSRSTFHVAMPITCPQGEMAGETAGSNVMGSIQPGKGLSLSTYFSSSLPPQRFLYRS